MRDDIVRKWQERRASVAIIGLGYVGLPLALSFVAAGVRTIGVDIDSDKVSLLKSGRSDLGHIKDSAISEALSCGFSVSSDISVVSESDGIIMCLPTPLSATYEPDLSYIRGSLASLLPHLRAGQVLALESTTYPGTTDEEIAPALKAAGFDLGDNFFLVYSPEREDPGNGEFSTSSIPKILGGYTDSCSMVGLSMYETAICRMVPVSDTRTAEMVKLLENIYRVVNIGLVNEMKQVSHSMGIDIYEVIEAASSKPFGFTAFYPGPGVGGHCIPVDPFYLTWRAKAYGLHTRFIELAGQINRSMPSYVVRRLSAALNDRSKSVKGSEIWLMGVSYKRNIGDLRGSPALEIIELLRQRGAIVRYSDPFVERLSAFDLAHVDLDEVLLGSVDAVVIVSDHDVFDYGMIGRCASLIIDGRGRFSADAENVVCA